jgi:transcriptional regulator with XRE-family HTH domain
MSGQDAQGPQAATREGAPSSVGERLRELRVQRGMSLSELAASTGLSRSFLSRAERGISAASVGSLLAWTNALGVTIGALFDPELDRLHRPSRVPAFEMPGVTEYLLTPRDETRFEVFEEHLDPGGTPDPRFWSVDADCAFVYVVHGAVDMEFGHGERVLRLTAGELHVYSPREPHRWTNASQDRTVLLAFESPARRF